MVIQDRLQVVANVRTVRRLVAITVLGVLLVRLVSIEFSPLYIHIYYPPFYQGDRSIWVDALRRVSIFNLGFSSRLIKSRHVQNNNNNDNNNNRNKVNTLGHRILTATATTTTTIISTTPIPIPIPITIPRSNHYYTQRNVRTN